MDRPFCSLFVQEKCRKDFEIPAAFKLDRYDGIELPRSSHSGCEIRKEQPDDFQQRLCTWKRRTRNNSQVRDQMRCEGKHIDLLLISSETDDNFHYTGIKNMSALICRRTKHGMVVHMCPHCVHPFASAREFADHFPDCSKHVYQSTMYPNRSRTKAS
jgi:hypothetical protein